MSATWPVTGRSKETKRRVSDVFIALGIRQVLISQSAHHGAEGKMLCPAGKVLHIVEFGRTYMAHDLWSLVQPSLLLDRQC